DRALYAVDDNHVGYTSTNLIFVGWVDQVISSTMVTVKPSYTPARSTAAIGYGTGAGGTVTQLTDRSTGVIINKLCGQITMNAASLAAGAEATFTVTNSTVAATDTVVVCIQSGNVTGTPAVNVSAMATDSFPIT